MPSQLFRNILFPTDFSKSSEAAISHVVGLAKSANAKVCLLSVVPSLEDWHGPLEDYFGQPTGSALVRLKAELKTMEMGRLKRLESVQKQHFGALESEISVRSGAVAESIIEYADEIKAELIMVPTRGLGVMRRFLIGSVASKILHDATCAVWTTPHPRELESFQAYRHILVAIDYRRLPAAELLSAAVPYAEYFHAQLSVVSVLPYCSEQAQPNKREMTEALKNQFAAARMKASVHLLEGNPGETVREIAEMEDADLIITGRGHLEEFMGHLRTHLYEIIWYAPCPVITLPHS
jgi:nucleotide-binding universal stress UspA family protein